MVEFKRASAADLDVLLKMMALYYDFDALPFDPVKAEKALNNLVSDPSLGQLWLISAPSVDSVVGYFVISYGFSLESGGREAFIDELFVLESFRGKGVGTKALQHAISQCKEVGAGALRLEVTHKNTGANRLYQKLGFQDLGRSLLTQFLH